jgi:hypothetical protein
MGPKARSTSRAATIDAGVTWRLVQCVLDAARMLMSLSVA